MLYFQLLVLCGAGLAHCISTIDESWQRTLLLIGGLVTTTALIVGALIWPSPITPSLGWLPRSAGAATPQLDLLLMLVISCGMPGLLLCTAGPLLQRWSATTLASRTYRLYAWSNAGSLLALLAYPLAIEPWLSLPAQGWAWAIAAWIYLALLFVLALRLPHAPPAQPRSAALACKPSVVAELLRWSGWVALSCAPVVLLLGVTHHLGEEVAVVPLLWVVPLAGYLLSWVATFSTATATARWPWQLGTLLALAAQISVWTLGRRIAPGAFGLLIEALTSIVMMFCCCGLCHNELARWRPPAHQLTRFYLAIGMGGALAGIMAAIAAPLLLPATWELPSALLACLVLAAASQFRDPQSALHRGHRHAAAATIILALPIPAALFERELAGWLLGIDSETPRALELAPLHGGALLLALVILVGLQRQRRGSWLDPRRALWTRLAVATLLLLVALVAVRRAVAELRSVEHIERNFFGVKKIASWEAPWLGRNWPLRTLTHGMVRHGAQLLDPAHRHEPTSYYGRESGIGRLLTHHPRREQHAGLRIAMIGMGAGAIAALAQPGDTLTIYEVDPAIIRLAGPGSPYFSFIDETAAHLEAIHLGDARIELERELATAGARQFDVIAVDAFTGGAIPLHLLTREALATYLAHLRDRQGVVALHLSNAYLDLTPIARATARDLGCRSEVLIHLAGKAPAPWENDSEWLLVCRDPAVLDRSALEAIRWTSRLPAPVGPGWTDDRSDLIRALRGFFR
jgi:hypothetical protein